MFGTWTCVCESGIISKWGSVEAESLALCIGRCLGGVMVCKRSWVHIRESRSGGRFGSPPRRNGVLAVGASLSFAGIIRRKAASFATLCGRHIDSSHDIQRNVRA